MATRSMDSPHCVEIRRHIRVCTFKHSLPSCSNFQVSLTFSSKSWQLSSSRVLHARHSRRENRRLRIRSTTLGAHNWPPSSGQLTEKPRDVGVYTLYIHKLFTCSVLLKSCHEFILSSTLFLRPNHCSPRLISRSS